MHRQYLVIQTKRLSFREYLAITHEKNFQPIDLEAIRLRHVVLAKEITDQINPLPSFKAYLRHTVDIDLLYCLSPEREMDNIRRYFLVNQFINAGLNIRPTAEGNFRHGTTTIEVSGRSARPRIYYLSDWLIAADGIKAGTGNKIPLWLFGFLY